jgi:uncharacterized protein
MRRKEKELTERSDIDSVIRNSQVCRLAMTDGNEPYIVPLCFGYDGNSLFFHSAKDGRKLDILQKNNRVCFEFDIVEGITEAPKGCGWGIKYRSVIGYGETDIINNPDDKCRALSIIMKQYTPENFTFTHEDADRVTVIEVRIDSISGKQSKRD